MTVSADKKSTKADIIHKGGQRQRTPPGEFGERLRSAMEAKGLRNSELADVSGVSRQLVSEYATGQKVAGADNLFALADALDVFARWLLKGEGPRDSQRAEAADLTLPQFDPFAFSEYGKGPPISDVAVPRWLLAPVKQTSGLWLCEMPSGALPDVAAEGEMIVCIDPDVPLQDRRVYIFVIDGRPLVRRLWVRPDGLQLTGETDSDTLFIRPEDAENIIPVGRVLASISLNQV